ncbi:PREDICTED: microfibril-associated glycoprotein 4-like [Branchiostoma belcheri]|uniref:Microfibril-associated glycoprotein 4-like n=1 Tax=Branchiostoma belcheri TaxID=7741 RepID=A0A6P4Z5Y0_BRABE|nr:PREDICTED: microfibril-associated glycoprotein 4-like [Branchiostoma belcheri]
MLFLRVLVVVTVLQWSVVTGEGLTDQFTLSLCRVWEECIETATENNLGHSELGTPEAICGDFLDMLKKHGVDCGTSHGPEEEKAGVEQVLSYLDPLPSNEEQQEELAPGDEEETNRGVQGHKLPLNRPVNTDDVWRTTYFDDCSEWYTAQAISGPISSGVFSIKPAHVAHPISVYCDQTTDGGGWTVIQRRFDGSLEFFRQIGAYQNGFGDSSGEYWLGLETIYRITAQNTYELYIELEDWSGNVKFARYSSFSVGPGDDHTLSVGGYSGTAGDGFYLSHSSHTNNGMKFSTRWHDQDTSSGSMAELYGGGWWYGSWSHSDLNGPYFRDTDGFNNNNGRGVFWYPFNNKEYYSLKKTKMMIRPTDFSTRVANMRQGKE